MQHSVGTDEEQSAALLVAVAEALLTAQNPSVPSDFIAGLFDRAAPEDLIRYDGRDIVALAEFGLGLLRGAQSWHAEAAHRVAGRRR